MVYPQFSYAMEDVRLRQQALEDKFDAELDSIDRQAIYLYGKDKALAVKFITDFSINQAEEATAKWKKIGEYLMVKRLDGVLKMEENGKFVQNEKGIPQHVVRPGYPTDYARDEFVTPNPDRFRVKTKEELDKRK